MSVTVKEGTAEHRHPTRQSTKINDAGHLYVFDREDGGGQVVAVHAAG